MGDEEVSQFFTHLGVQGKVASSSQNQAAKCEVIFERALNFMYRKNKVLLISTRFVSSSFRHVVSRNDEEIDCSVFLPEGHHVKVLFARAGNEHARLRMRHL